MGTESCRGKRRQKAGTRHREAPVGVHGKSSRVEPRPWKLPPAGGPCSVALVRAASECGEIGRRLLGAAAAMERIGRTGKGLECYEAADEELLEVLHTLLAAGNDICQVHGWGVSAFFSDILPLRKTGRAAQQNHGNRIISQANRSHSSPVTRHPSLPHP